VTLEEFGRGRADRASFVARERDDEPLMIPPCGTTQFAVGDHLIVAGDSAQIELMTQLSGGEAVTA
jgi:Trk K+ transport system NAD-binding subunit